MDLRLSAQHCNGFYIWKKKGGYSVGKNGTDKHKFFSKSPMVKAQILAFIYS